MLQASLRELIEEGSLGSLTLQMPCATLRAALGDPDDFSTMRSSDGQPKIWKYGDMELHFSEDDDTLWLIHTDTFPAHPRGGGKLRLDLWIFRHSLTAEVLRGLCQQLHLPCREFVVPWMGPEERRFTDYQPVNERSPCDAVPRAEAAAFWTHPMSISSDRQGSPEV
jgi:hypothetical protein